MSMPTPSLEIKVCRCGLRMVMSRKVPDVGMCSNCDGIQPQEKMYNADDLDEDGEEQPFKRATTPWDRKYQEVIELELAAQSFPTLKNGTSGL